ncbi:hypothetical protein E4U43_006327 [Claviceps pusilla]|uniref:Uncharacterized protein n=1 Tax=Claviceps pusilla TaxID=123648 RepID=A0A9P7N1M5_9HYPO|nr:hypothetical protein E4U43_006327 [Claviceps pusilla]
MTQDHAGDRDKNMVSKYNSLSEHGLGDGKCEKTQDDSSKVETRFAKLPTGLAKDDAETAAKANLWITFAGSWSFISKTSNKT